MAFSMAMPWNDGEEKMHKLLRVPPQDNPTSSMLTPQASFMLQRGSLLALGTLDSDNRPWVTLFGGSPGFSEPLGGGFIGTRTLVDSQYDPVVQALVGGAKDGEMLQPPDGGKMLAGLAFDLMTRKRVKIGGKMVAGTVREVNVALEGSDEEQAPQKQAQIQLVTKIEESLGNCPKYLNQYEIRPALVQAHLTSSGLTLSSEAEAMIKRSDMFLLSTGTPTDMDVNHRGGAAGFVRIVSPTCIVYPEFSGNRLYQSLGNLQLNPRIGMIFPDHDTGDVLYITGTAEILVGDDAAKLLPGSNLVVKIELVDSRFVKCGLPFRGTRKTPSPYNPRIRPLATEGNIKSALSSTSSIAQLTNITPLTPSIARFSFSVPSGIHYSAGQWIALDFKGHLDTGYEHMRDEDPGSLNDDFVRTFTISSAPTNASGKQDGFEITVRNVGPVTKFLFRQNVRAGFEVPILGVGGEFEAKQEEGRVTPFVAGGVGITPLLGQVGRLDLGPGKFKLLWAVRGTDFGMVVDTMERYAGLKRVTEVFLTGTVGDDGADEKVKELEAQGVKVSMRRLAKDDVDLVEAETWYLCAGKTFRKEVLSWLEGKNVVFEDFDY
jgi:ferredoxin-NADP reductase/predicted pyridoxine 5'-phosphate oxidase superfamily flavin-nucleotide-binding protein